ncbi:disintegrin and metalloproteinase domain-containing protein 1-like [Dromiciops gliroides]|uniref:disintegrin and metalloproteinase domain-containing protein 1-like n=1 Tax=Dromiciops gliroides TaxID=33562 RepID=UPI001CC5DB70|nr:disintegrin and metalloproteinase domain-containing protein 1-like [Dromiciops gliroides]
MDEEEREFPSRGPQMKSLGFGLSPSRVKLGVFLLLVEVFFPGMYCIQRSVYYSFYEIIIPRRLVSWRREDQVEKMHYSFFMKRRWHVISLKQKKGTSVQNFPVYTYSNGIPGLDMPFIQYDCYYDGYLVGDRGSFASINTCAGLKGILSIQTIAFGISPVKSSNKFEHAVYRLSKVSRDACGVKERESPEFWASVKGLSPTEPSPAPFPYAWSHTKYLEVFIVVDNMRFQMWDRNVTTTTQTLMDVLALVNRYMKQINVEVALAGVEIWSEKDLVQISWDLQETLYGFNRWQASELPKRARHDVAHLVTGRDLGTHQGQAFVGSICTPGNGTGVEVFHHEDVPRFAALLAHELSHNLGMKHDHPGCTCPNSLLCSMHKSIPLEGSFSNCSVGSFYEMLARNQGACLYDKPQSRSPLGRRYCGNKVAEEEEECDCGSVGDCMKDRCCLPSCRLRRGSACASGPCCSKCKFLKAATPCRPSVDECDLPEYCNGSSPWCQPDTYKQDGSPCRGGGYCYQGRCRSLESQCVQVFGEGSRAAPARCYRMNTQGDRFGNCGSKWQGQVRIFMKCQPEDVLCGSLYCENVRRLPRLKSHQALIQFLAEGAWCWGADLHTAPDGPDGGSVKDGTSCGPRKICVNRSCLDVQATPRSDCSLVKCHARGVCNNLKNCHCDPGYDPPACTFPGAGGSLDSGPSPKLRVIPQKVEALLWFLMVIALLLTPVVFAGICFWWRVEKARAKEFELQADLLGRELG